MNLKKYLKKISLEKDEIGNYLDEWINIFERLHIRTDKYANGETKIIAVYSPLDYSYDKVFNYPFTDEIYIKFLSIQELDIGNSEMAEVVRISNIEALRYLKNLEEITICNNTVTSLLPLYGRRKLKKVWIENTMISIEDRKYFTKCNPNVKLEAQIYL